MTVRRLNPVTGDIVTSGVQFISEREEIAQTIRTRLRLFLGEYFRNITDGTPWFRDVLGKGAGEPIRQAAIKQRISRTPGVIKLVRFEPDYDIDARTYSVTAEVLTEFGTIEIGESING